MSGAFPFYGPLIMLISRKLVRMIDRLVPYLWGLALLCLLVSDNITEKGMVSLSHGLMVAAAVLFFVIPLVWAIVESSKAHSSKPVAQI